MRGGGSSADGGAEAEIGETVVVVQVGHGGWSDCLFCFMGEEAEGTTIKREFSLYISLIAFRDRHAQFRL